MTSAYTNAPIDLSFPGMKAASIEVPAKPLDDHPQVVRDPQGFGGSLLAAARAHRLSRNRSLGRVHAVAWAIAFQFFFPDRLMIVTSHDRGANHEGRMGIHDDR